MRIVDLFSGAGGLTFGFYYKLVNGEFIENENCEIVFANEWDKCAAEAFRKNFPSINMINKDIKSLTENEIKENTKNKEVDLIIGGPPCQSYSTIGQRKYDDKAKMYQEYYRLLSIIKPKMFLFENVKGMLSMKNPNGGKVIDDVKKKFKEINYDIDFKVLDAADYGVPQHRERVFIIGCRKDLNINWSFENIEKSKKQISIKQAINDLSTREKYIIDSKKLSCHFSPIYGDKIQTVINHVKQGKGKNYINELVDKGVIPKEYRLTSGYDNTYGRLIENQPSTTITNNMSTPSGLRCIHYEENRALTPREGARIQSFPDWFEFVGTKKDITTQIGNAVPPLLAMKIATQIEKVLSEV